MKAGACWSRVAVRRTGGRAAVDVVGQPEGKVRVVVSGAGVSGVGVSGVGVCRAACRAEALV